MVVKIFGLSDRLSFGKYKGRAVKDILYADPSYLIWANDNVKWFVLENNIYKMAVDEIFNDKMYKYLNKEFGFHHFYDDDVYEPY